MRYTALLAILIALLANCGRTTPVSVSAPTAGATTRPTDLPTAAPAPTAVPIPTSVPIPTDLPIPTLVPTTALVPTTDTPATPLQSGGLGLTRAEWEKKHGAGAEETLGYTYEGKQYLVMYQADPAGVETVWHLEQRFTDGISIVDARKMSEQLLPDDFSLTKTYTTPTDQIVGLYRSNWLKERFPARMKAGKLDLPMWVNGEPGDFTVGYRTDANKATSIIIGIGNNP